MRSHPAHGPALPGPTHSPEGKKLSNETTRLANGNVRAITNDDTTLDISRQFFLDARGMPQPKGKVLDHAFKTHDGKTVDSTGAFLIGELERLDPTLHMPLAAVTWQRDIDLREDVTVADEFSSFTQTTFGSAGNLGAGNGIRNGKAWIGKATDQIGGIGVDTGKVPQPLTPWGLEVKYSLLELASAAQMGRPIDDQKIEGLKLKHQMDIDEQVYVGDANIGVTGLINNVNMTNVSNVPNGAGGQPAWSTKTPAEILADVNALLQSVWAASGYARMPTKILLPPAQFGAISAAVVSTAGSVSILEYLLKNNIVVSSGMGKLMIAPCKWCVGAGVGGTIGTAGAYDRMIAYTQGKGPRPLPDDRASTHADPVRLDLSQVHVLLSAWRGRAGLLGNDRSSGRYLETVRLTRSVERKGVETFPLFS